MGLAEARRAARRARRTYWKNELVRLPDNAYVVRGGTCQFRDLLRSAEMTRETIGEWAVSAASGVDTLGVPGASSRPWDRVRNDGRPAAQRWLRSHADRQAATLYGLPWRRSGR